MNHKLKNAFDKIGGPGTFGSGFEKTQSYRFGMAALDTRISGGTSGGHNFKRAPKV